MAHPAQLALSVHIRDDASFENYFAGPNQEVIESLRLACNGKSSAGAIFLNGAAGVGKSHLLQACCHVAGEQGLAAVYLPLTELVDEGPDLLEGLEQLALICLDDVQIIAGKEAWEQAVFHFFNRAFDRGVQLVFAADRGVTAMGILLPDLASRLAWGFVYRLHALDDEQKLQAIQERAKHRGFVVPDDVGRFLLRRFPRDMRALHAMLHELDVASLAAQRSKISIPFVKSWLENRNNQETQASLF